ncbi:MAG: hypothetical protein CL943_01880 [Candidatus Diapherotrites archaeon]|uniref:Uncharacterized protein n=1 Tax=Candidatus Iainarchaeum sp. TaxID=3101447 RepID=A0A2D6M0T7_9ARCH|nr:hypothetical protein [Candidatus Diapherotrites archaeon]|tara:strand:- start:1716 stop:2204 length:489 start_codon:yes stop_codon:yes gene_type:complete
MGLEIKWTDIIAFVPILLLSFYVPFNYIYEQIPELGIVMYASLVLFWFWMLVDAIRRPLKNKETTIVILVLVFFFAAFGYYLGVKRKDLKNVNVDTPLSKGVVKTFVILFGTMIIWAVLEYFYRNGITFQSLYPLVFLLAIFLMIFLPLLYMFKRAKQKKQL